MNKTITVATKNGERKIVSRQKSGWKLPPEEGYGAFINGTGAYKECVARWEEFGWDVKKEPNPQYKPRNLFRFR